LGAMDRRERHGLIGCGYEAVLGSVG
jgi:hypothetical protein